MEEIRNAYKNQLGNLKGRDTWETKCRCEDLLTG
jgi:hypothetical protein